MGKAAVSSQAFCGIDVSAATLAAAVQRGDREGFEQREFANSAAGHRQRVEWLGKRGAMVRVSLEATGIYSLDVALALDRAGGLEVAVLNPKTVNRFAQTLRRSKTDAVALAEYSLRMPFVPWQRPSPVALAPRAISRHSAALTRDPTRASNRLHAAEGSATTPRCVREDLKRSMAGFGKRIARLRKQALAMVRQDAVLQRKFEQLVAMPGIAETSAVQLLKRTGGTGPEDDGASVGGPQWARPGAPAIRHVDPSSVAHQPPRQQPSPARALHAGARGLAARLPSEGFFSGPAGQAKNQAPGHHGRSPETASRHLRSLQNRNSLRWSKLFPQLVPTS